MRCVYRENLIKHGDYMDVNVYPCFCSTKNAPFRRKRAKPTSEVQQKLNERYAIKRVTYLINENFTKNDYALHLTYDDKHIPKDFDAAVHEEEKFRRRLRRMMSKHGIEFKYFSVTEESSKKKRCHHHFVVSGGLSIGAIAELWGNGYIQVKPLQFDEFGVTNLSCYINKDRGGRMKLSHSRNLKEPAQKKRDGKVSQKKVKALAGYDIDEKEFCKEFYPGYTLADIEPFYNEVNGFYYLTLRLYKSDLFKKRKRGADYGGIIQQ